MKKVLLFILSLIMLISVANAAITFDSKEYKPTGKHYSIKWNKLYYATYKEITDEKLTLLYFKTDKNLIIFKGIWISKSLEAKVPMVVIKYIGKYITDIKLKETHSIEDAINATKQAISKALDRTWLDNLKSNSVSFSDRPLYKRENAGFDMNYYEFFPLEKNNLTNPTDLHDTTVYKVYTDSVLNFQKVILEKSKILSEVKDNLLKKPDFDKTIKEQAYRYDNLKAVITKLASLSYHHESLKVSDWPLASSTKWILHDNAPNGFHADVDSTCKYLMAQSTIKKEQPMPAMAWRQNYGEWKATRCNMFAGDFSQQTLLLNTYPWGTKYWRAHEIYENLLSNKDFVPLTWDKVWEYANMGYPVFITIPKIGPAGHIAIAYPIDQNIEQDIIGVDEALDKGMVVQAGNKNGLMSLKEGFSLTADQLQSKASIYVYLGYLKL